MTPDDLAAVRQAVLSEVRSTAPKMREVVAQEIRACALFGEPLAYHANPPRDLVLDQIGFSFSADSRLADIITFCKYSYFELKIIDKVFYMGHIDQYPSGGGIAGSTSQNSESVWNIGTANPHATLRFSANLSKYIAPQRNWSLVLYFPPTSGPSGAAASLLTAAQTGGTGGVTLDIYLNGLTDRAVQ